MHQKREYNFLRSAITHEQQMLSHLKTIKEMEEIEYIKKTDELNMQITAHMTRISDMFKHMDYMEKSDGDILEDMCKQDAV